MNTTLQNFVPETDLEQYVLDYVTEYYETEEEQKCFFTDLQYGGCVSGMVSDLIYYSDTHAFYDKYYDYIEDLRYEYEESTACELSP